MFTLNSFSKMAFLMVANLAMTTSFGQSNTITLLTDLGTRHDYAYSIAIQDDGRVIVAGDADGKPCMVRFDSTGVLDDTFGTFGIVFASWYCGSNPADNDIKIQTDGKIILGTRYFNGNNDDFIVARYHADGTPDFSFGNNGQVITQIGNDNDWCNSIAIQADGKIVAAGGVITGFGTQGEYNCDFALLRYNPDGTLDPSFGNNGTVITHIGAKVNIAYSMAIQQDGKIVLAGEANDSLFSDFAIARYNPDGSLDNSLGIGGIVRTALSSTYDHATSVAVQMDDKIVVAGSAQNGFSNSNFAIIRYHANGSQDSTFGINGIVTTDIGNEYAYAIALQPDNKIILAGSLATSTIYDFAALRYDPDGSLDLSFGTDGLITTSFGTGSSEGQALALGADGEIIIAGSYNKGSPEYFDFALVRLFSKLTAQVIPTLFSPGDGETVPLTNPTLTWNAIPGAAGYHLQVATNDGFENLVINDTALISTSYPECQLSDNTTYFWRIRASIDGSFSRWSNIWMFSTNTTTHISGENAESVKFYTNPIHGTLVIGGIGDEPGTVSIFSMEGKLVKQWTGPGIKEIDVREIQQGIYLLRISNSKVNYARKIIIE